MCQTINKTNSKYFCTFCTQNTRKRTFIMKNQGCAFILPYMCIFYHIRQKAWWFRSLFLDLVDLNCQVDCSFNVFLYHITTTTICSLKAAQTKGLAWKNLLSFDLLYIVSIYVLYLWMILGNKIIAPKNCAVFQSY